MYLVSYDLSSDRLRQKIAKELENNGRRVQYSVFECDISQKQMTLLYGKLAQIMLKEEQGSIRIYSLCANCRDKVRLIGIDEQKEKLTEEEEGLFII